MPFLDQEIADITEATWQAMLGLDLRTSPVPVSINFDDDFLTGRVEISGGWNGWVILHGSGLLAHEAAALIFADCPSKLTLQDRRDAMYELTNVIAGNIKTLLPESCQLSLPQVLPSTAETREVAHAECVSEVMFDYKKQPLYVSLWKREGSNH